MTDEDFNYDRGSGDLARNSYECKVCKISCNSESVYQAHVNGRRHKKKLSDAGSSPCEPVTKKAKVKDLRQMLLETYEPCIGLHYLEELLPSNPSGEEPIYLCNLCCVSANSTPMFTHLTGFKHRQKYLEMRYNERDLDKSQISLKCQHIHDQEGRRLDLIKTICSDEKYPWPPGKAPWSGQPVGTTPQSENESSQVLFSRKSDEQSLTESPVCQLLEGLAKCSVKNEEDARVAFEVSKKMLRALVHYKMKALSPPYNETLARDHQDICQKIELIYGIPSKNIALASNLNVGSS